MKIDVLIIQCLKGLRYMFPQRYVVRSATNYNQLFESAYLGVEVEDLFGPERTLETAFAGSHCCQILLQLVQRTQRRTAWTEIEKRAELSTGSLSLALRRLGLTSCK